VSCQPASTPFGPIPRFTHRGSACGKTSDPINIVAFDLKPADLRARLWGRPSSSKGAAWRGAGFFSGTQSIDATGSCRRQDEDLVAGGLWERIHMRIWRWAPIGSVAAAHKEFGITIGAGPRNAIHRPTSYDTGRDTVLRDVIGRLRPRPEDLLELHNYVPDPIASGAAAMIR